MRLGRWLMWSVAFSLAPFLAVFLIRGVDAGVLPGMTTIFGSGQLLLTSAALLGSGVKELASTADKNFWTEFLNFTSMIFMIPIAAMYGYAVKTTAIENLASRQSGVVIVSLIFFAISLVVAGFSIGITSPPKTSIQGRP